MSRYFGIAVLSVIYFTGCSHHKNELPASASAMRVPPIQKRSLEKPPSALASSHPSLVELIEYALLNNPETKVAYLRAKQAQEKIIQANAASLPSLSLLGQFLRVRKPDFPASDQRFWESSYGPQLYLTYTLLDFGQAKNTRKEAIATMRSLNFVHTSTLQKIIQQVRDGYFDLITQKELTLAAQSDLENAQANLEVAKAKYFLGVVSALDLSQAETNYFHNQSSLLAQKNQEKTAFFNLTHTLGNPTQDPFQTHAFDKAPKEIEFKKAQHFIAITQQLNPQVGQLRQQIKAARFALKAIQSQTLPTISTSLQTGRTYFNGGVHDDYDVALQFNFTLPLYKGGSLRSQIRSAKHQVRILEEKLHLVRNQLTHDVLVLESSLESAYEQMQVAEKTLSSAQKQYEVAFAQYKAGVTDILTLINAQTRLSETKAQFIQSQKNWHVTITDIALTMGILYPGNIPEDILFKKRGSL